jgi:RNA recognition motif-containing protein
MNRDVKTLKTIWVGDIEAWMDEKYLAELFGKSGTVVTVKIIRDKITHLPLGYGFVEFDSHQVAAKVLDLFNGSTHPGTNKPFRLNWGVHGAGRNSRDSFRDNRGFRDSRDQKQGVSVSVRSLVEVLAADRILTFLGVRWRLGYFSDERNTD